MDAGYVCFYNERVDLYRLPAGRRPDAHLDAWLARASRSRIRAILDLSRTIRRHRGQILAAVDLGLSNSKLEGLNSKIRLINHRGYGNHSAAAVIAMIYPCCSGLTNDHAAHRKVRRTRLLRCMAIGSHGLRRTLTPAPPLPSSRARGCIATGREGARLRRRGHATFALEAPHSFAIRGRPVRAGATGDEADGVALVVDAFGLGVDPAVAQCSLQQLVEGHGLLAGGFLVDGDDPLSLGCAVVAQPAIELVRGGDRRCLRDIERAHSFHPDRFGHGMPCPQQRTIELPFT